MSEKNDSQPTTFVEENDHAMGSPNVEEVFRNMIDIIPIMDEETGTF